MPHSILLVDDDPAIIQLAATALEAAGYTVRAASNGDEAIEAVRTERPDMVVTDWLMPAPDGLELCRMIREIEDFTSRIYVIMLSGQRAPGRLVEALEVGADDYIHKPFNTDELVARVRSGSRLIALKADLKQKEIQLHRRNAELEVAHQELSRLNRHLDEIATTDELTGLANRRSAMAAIDRRWLEINRDPGAMAMVLVDIDHFKRINDTWGHDAGDAVLAQVAAALDGASRTTEDVFRLGGEEFLLFCRAATAAEAAVAAERMREAVESLHILHGGRTIRCTASFGVAERRGWMRSSCEVLKAADEALYESKHAGRNRVTIADPHPRFEPLRNAA
jgi:two-component system cell cycle response regulator